MPCRAPVLAEPAAWGGLPPPALVAWGAGGAGVQRHGSPHCAGGAGGSRQRLRDPRLPLPSCPRASVSPFGSGDSVIHPPPGELRAGWSLQASLQELGGEEGLWGEGARAVGLCACPRARPRTSLAAESPRHRLSGCPDAVSKRKELSLVGRAKLLQALESPPPPPPPAWPSSSASPRATRADRPAPGAAPGPLARRRQPPAQAPAGGQRREAEDALFAWSWPALARGERLSGPILKPKRGSWPGARAGTRRPPRAGGVAGRAATTSSSSGRRARRWRRTLAAPRAG